MTLVRNRIRPGLLAVLGYGPFVLALSLAEYLSEEAKFDRGVYSDTSPPTLFVQIFTLPLSAILNGPAPSYPRRAAFDRPLFESVLQQRVAIFLTAGLVQWCLMLLLLYVIRRRERGAGTLGQ
jgi:hypothetical protein